MSPNCRKISDCVFMNGCLANVLVADDAIEKLWLFDNFAGDPVLRCFARSCSGDCDSLRFLFSSLTSENKLLLGIFLSSVLWLTGLVKRARFDEACVEADPIALRCRFADLGVAFLAEVRLLGFDVFE